jgi:16S rRNA (uracil1498-N3)-methyltransferase
MHDHHQFLFFASKIEADRLELDPEEARHAVAVLRHAIGDSLRVTDGAGTLYECRVEATGKDHVSAAILGRTTLQRHACPLRLFIGLPERDAFEPLVRDLAALGVERITPVIAAHCQRPWWEPWEGKPLVRLRGKMIAGMKQSSYPFLPTLDPPLPFNVLKESSLFGMPLVADAEGEPFSTMAEKIQAGDNGYSCIVGPPGGFTEDEGATLQEIGALPVKIASSRLTTELAAVVMTSEILGVRLR